MTYNLDYMTELIYMLAPEEEEHRRLCLRRLVLNEAMPAHIVDRSGPNDFFFAYFPHSCTVGSREGIRQCSAHSWICWGPQDRHYYGREDASWMHSCFHIIGSDAERLFAALPKNTVGVIHNPPAFDACLQMIYYNAQHDIDVDMLSHNVESLVQLCIHTVRSPIDDEMFQVKAYLDENFKKELQLDDIASIFHISVSSLRARFKRSFQNSVIDYLIQRRLRHACYLLKNQQMSIADIARQVGYRDSAYFSRLIKKHFGKNPRSLRQSWRED